MTSDKFGWVSHSNFEIHWSPFPACGKKIPSHINDANHFINKIKNVSVPIKSILVTMDVDVRHSNK